MFSMLFWLSLQTGNKFKFYLREQEKIILRHELLNTQGNLQISRYNYESENCLRPNQRLWTPPSVARYVLFSCLIYLSCTTHDYVMVMLINTWQIYNIYLRTFLLKASTSKGQNERSRLIIIPHPKSSYF